MRFTIAAAALAAFVSTGAASAQFPLAQPLQEPGKFSISAGYSLVDDDLQLSAIAVRAGYDFIPYFGVEGEFATGTGSSEFAGADVTLDSHAALYGVGRLPFDQKGSNVFLRVGFGTYSFGIEDPFFGSDTFDLTGTAAGLGVEYMVTRNVGIRGESTVVQEDLDEYSFLEARSYSISAAFRF